MSTLQHNGNIVKHVNIVQHNVNTAKHNGNIVKHNGNIVKQEWKNKCTCFSTRRVYFFKLRSVCPLCFLYPSFLICQNSVVTSVQKPTQIFFPFVAVAIYFWVGNSSNPCYSNSLLRKAGVSMSLAPYTDININPPLVIQFQSVQRLSWLPLTPLLC
jgi:hypothetical protein